MHVRRIINAVLRQYYPEKRQGAVITAALLPPIIPICHVFF